MTSLIDKIVFNIIKTLRPFPGTKFYWERRYRKGLSSGDGSSGNLATFKAKIINNFVAQNDIKEIAEFGCGDGNQLSLFQVDKYIGLDISPAAIALCKKRFINDKKKEFDVYHPNSFQANNKYALTISLDVLFHIIEEKLYVKYLSDLFLSSNKFVIIYGRNFDGPEDYSEKNRSFLPWIKNNISDFVLVEHIKNKFPFNPKDPKTTSHSEFYIFKKLLP